MSVFVVNRAGSDFEHPWFAVHVNSGHAIIKYQHTHYLDMVSASKPATCGVTQPFGRIGVEFSGVIAITITLAERFFTQFENSLERTHHVRCWRSESEHHTRDDRVIR